MRSIQPFQGKRPCACALPQHPKPVMIAVSGGPGGGKSTLLALAKEEFCRHVAVLPEAATILYSGGFPRTRDPEGIKAVQRAIWYVSHQLEDWAKTKDYAVILCDRGTLDGVAYWPDGEDDFYRDLSTTSRAEIERYDLLVHLQTPAGKGYDLSNPSRNEDPGEALDLDQRTAHVWRDHPNRHVIASTDDFLQKVQTAFALIRERLPACCESHG